LGIFGAIIWGVFWGYFGIFLGGYFGDILGGKKIKRAASLGSLIF